MTKSRKKRGPTPYPLTPIKHLLDKGWSHQRIADHLGISKPTVTNARKRIILEAYLKGEKAVVPKRGRNEKAERSRARTAISSLDRLMNGLPCRSSRHEKQSIQASIGDARRQRVSKARN